MRYMIAMLGGTILAAIAAIFLCGSVSRWVSRSYVYTSPDGQNDVEQAVFLAILVAALIVGWAIGWLIGAPYANRERLD